MRRVAAVVAVVLAAAALVARARAPAPATATRYSVRAIFDNAGFVIPGEDVKVAGVKVGKIESLDVTPDIKAARRAATSTSPATGTSAATPSARVRPQSLIGERFVECTPTQPRAADAAPPPPLQQDRRAGRARASTCCRSPARSTTGRPRPDQQHHARCPYRERLSLILNELGTGLAGRGRDLNAVIRRRRTRRCSEIDKVLAHPRRAEPDAGGAGRELGHRPRAARARARPAWPSSAIGNIGQVAAATAERARRARGRHPTLPRFLARAAADDAAARRAGRPGDAGAAPTSARRRREVNTVVEQLGPFSTAAIPALDVARRAPASAASRPCRRRARSRATSPRWAEPPRPVGATLADAAASPSSAPTACASADGLPLLQRRRDQRLRRVRATTCARR